MIKPIHTVMVAVLNILLELPKTTSVYRTEHEELIKMDIRNLGWSWSSFPECFGPVVFYVTLLFS